jgi:L-lysine 2,3-aminomutase
LFFLTDDRIEYLVRKLRKIPLVKMMRFGTRTLVRLPDRVTDRLCRAQEGFHRVPTWDNMQLNHPKGKQGQKRRWENPHVFRNRPCGSFPEAS